MIIITLVRYLEQMVDQDEAAVAVADAATGLPLDISVAWPDPYTYGYTDF
jgi:hypothetical protein